MRNAAGNWWTQAVQDRLIALVLAMLVLVPLVATPAEKSLGGISALTLACFSIVLLVTLLMRTRWDLRPERLLAFVKTGANVPVLVFLALALVSWVMSPQKTLGALEVLRIGAGVLLYFVIGYQFRRSEYLSRLADTILFLSVSVSLIGFYQFSAGDQSRAVGPFSDHQLFGSFLMLLLPIVVAIALNEKAPKRQIVAQIAAVITASALLLAHSRSAWLGGLAGLGFLSLLALIPLARARQFGANKHYVALPLMLASCVVVFLFLWPQSQAIVDRMGTLKNISADASFNGRLETSRGAMTMMRQRPLTGFGVGAYSYYQKGFTGVGAAFGDRRGRPSLMEQAHNFYLQTGAELGFPGLLAMIAALLAFLVAGARRVLAMDFGLRRTLLLGSLGAVAAFSVDALGSPSWQFGQVSMLLWMAMGLGVSAMRPQAKRKDETQSPVRQPLTPRWVPITASLLAAACWSALAGPVALPIAAAVSGSPTAVSTSSAGTVNTDGNLLTAGALSGPANPAPTDVYVTPVSASIEPKNAKIRNGTSLEYTLYVTFSDGSVQDVSNSASTAFSSSGGQGSMTGLNNRYYQSRQSENDTPTIYGKYTFNSRTIQASTRLTIFADAAVPTSANLQPNNASIRGGSSLEYTLYVTFSDGSVQDVSTNGNTTFSSTNGQGRMLGQNNRYYQSRVKESDHPSISGSYTQNGATVNSTRQLTVSYP